VASATPLGFQSVTTEYDDHTPRVEGTIPGWLSGTLIRNGPGRFTVGDQRVNHWFDGLAMLRRYAFDDGAVQYSNRLLRTEAYADAEAGRLTGQFGTDTRGWRRLISTLRSAGLPEPTDNANVHVARIDGEYVALTEAPRRIASIRRRWRPTGRFSRR
jgi:Lignostilbene-alpha,beta-dioxygenase and related enzymes